MSFTLSKPTEFNPMLFWQQMADAGIQTDWADNVQDQTIEFLNLDESRQAEVQALLDAHPVTAVAEAERVQEWAVNENSIRDKMTNALANNKADIATAEAIAGQASFTQAQSANAIRELATQSARQARQINGIIRTMHRQFDDVE